MHGGCQGSALASIPLALGTPALFPIQPDCMNPKRHPQTQRGDALALVGNRKTPPQLCEPLAAPPLAAWALPRDTGGGGGTACGALLIL